MDFGMVVVLLFMIIAFVVGMVFEHNNKVIDKLQLLTDKKMEDLEK